MDTKLVDYVSHYADDDEYHQEVIEKYEQYKKTEIDTEYPHRVIMQGYYEFLDEMEDWCRERFGNTDKKCHWRGCPVGWDYWYKQSGLEIELHKELDVIRAKHGRGSDEGGQKIVDHYAYVKTREDAPPNDHYHEGVWVVYYVLKNGYDHCYQAFSFKDKGDAIQFKLHWGENG